MRLINKSIYALALASMMGLWSCSQDEALPGGQTTAKGHSVPVTLTVSRGDAQTRTELSENLATGGLNDVWESGDKLIAYDANGDYAGELIISEGWGTDTGVFTGEVTSENGQKEFNLWYTDPEATGADDKAGKPIYFNTKKEMVVDLSKMPKCNEVKDLSKMDILSKKITLNIKDNQATLVKDEVMVAHLAMARFSLNGIPTDKAGTLTVRGPLNGGKDATYAYDGINYKMRLSLATGTLEGTLSTTNDNGLVINNVKGGDNVYMAFIPGTYKLSFHADFDGVSYDYAFTNSTDLKAGVYYNAFTKAEGAEEGTIEGVNIPLQQEILAELHVHAGYAGATPEKIIVTKPFSLDAQGQPEAVFTLEDYSYYVENYGLATAPSGYVFKGWSEDDPIEYAGSLNVVDTQTYTITSYRYNRGDVYAVWEAKASVDHSKNPLLKWAPTNLVYDKTTKTSSQASNSYARSSLYQWGRNKGWADYIDAQGPNYSSGTNTYAVCTTTGQNVFGASDFTGNSSHTINWYNGASTDKLYVDYFLMNSTLCNNSYPEDYWPIAARQKDNWDSRAKECGYDKLTSDDWAVPSKADFEEILPSKLSLLTDDNLQYGYMETKPIDDNTDCIFRWRLVSRTENTTVALHIQALIIPKGKKYSSDEWVSDKNVKELYFGASGMVNPYIEKLYVHKKNGAYQSSNQRYRTGWTYVGEQIIANPAPDGFFESDVSTVGGVHIYFHDIWDGWALQGNYWSSDGYALKFAWDPYDQIGEGSYIKFEKEDKGRAFAVRCIKASNN